MRINGLITVFLLQQLVYAAFKTPKKPSEIQYLEISADAPQGYRSSSPVTDRTRTRRLALEEYERKCVDLVLKYQRLSHKLSYGSMILNDLENVHYVENAIINLNEIMNDDKYDRRLSFISTDERSLMEEIKLDLIGRLVKVHVDEIVSPSQCFINFDLTQPGDILQLTWFYVENHDSKENFIGFIQIKADEIKKCYHESFYKLVKKLGASKDLHLNASSDLDSDSDEANTSHDSTLSSNGSLTSESLSRESAPNSPHTVKANLSEDSDNIVGTDGSSTSECSQIILLADEIHELDISWTSDVNVNSGFVSQVESGDSGTIVDISDLKRNPLDLFFISGSDTNEGGSEKDERLDMSKPSVKTDENTEKIVSEKPFVELLENVGAFDIPGDGKKSKDQEPLVSTADEDGIVNGGAGEDVEKKKKKRRNKKKAAKLVLEEEVKKSQDEELNVAPVLVDVADSAGSKSTSGVVESSNPQTSKSEEEKVDQSLEDKFSELDSKIQSVQYKINLGQIFLKIDSRCKDVFLKFPIILVGDFDSRKVLDKYHASKSAFERSMYGFKQMEKYLKGETCSILTMDLQVLEQIKLRILECNRITKLVLEFHHFHKLAIESEISCTLEIYQVSCAFACAHSLNYGLVFDFAEFIYRNLEEESISEVIESCFKPNHRKYFEDILRNIKKYYDPKSSP